MTLSFRATLTLIVIALAWWFGGAAGLWSLALYAVLTSAGLPLGFALFGRTHAAGWAAGWLLGYALSSFAFWIPIALGRPGRGAFVLSWILLAVACVVIGRRVTRPVVTLPEWTKRDTAALLLVLHLVPLVVAAPFARAGEQDASGTRYYRAYFTADFVWHMALTRELARFEPELRNPYLADEQLHYYWTYFLPAAVVATRGEANPSADVDATLKIGATLTALLLVSMIYCAAWAATGRRWAAIAATAIAVLAPSFEGLYAIRFHRALDQPLSALREINIDAVSAWQQYGFNGLRIDNLPRAMWWTPQHSMSCALGLIGVLAVARATALSLGGALLTGLALGLSVSFNPLLGAMFCAIFGVTTVIDLVARRLTLARAAVQAIAVVPVALGLWWCFAAGMSAGAEALTFGLHQFARHAPFQALFISLGAVLIPALIGLVPSRFVPFRPALPGLVGLVLGLLLMHYVTITESSWVGFRAGNVILVTVAMLVARGLVIVYNRGGFVLASALAGVLLATGLPTTAIDWFNARDLENRALGPGFLWVIPYSPDQQAGYEWVKKAIPPDAVVQFDPIVRARQNWSAIPTFTGRRMVAAIPISLLPQTYHEEISGRVHAIYTQLPAEQAHAAARSMGIDYLWVDEEDVRAPSGASLQRLFDRPDLFQPVFRRGDTTVLALSK